MRNIRTARAPTSKLCLRLTKITFWAGTSSKFWKGNLILKFSAKPYFEYFSPRSLETAWSARYSLSLTLPCSSFTWSCSLLTSVCRYEMVRSLESTLLLASSSHLSDVMMRSWGRVVRKFITSPHAVRSLLPSQFTFLNPTGTVFQTPAFGRPRPERCN